MDIEEIIEANTIDATIENIEIEDEIQTPKRKLYFINEIVEFQLTRYLWTGCTSIDIRDEIMANASELIRQIIRKQGLHTIYPGQDDSSFQDLLNVAWCQLERTLYKYRANPHCRKCFNPDRPSDSLLYKSGEHEYGIKTIQEVIQLHKNCPKCKTKLEAVPLVAPCQGRYGGTESILFRGQSKVFNMWCVAPTTLLFTDVGIKSIDSAIDDYNNGKMINAYGLNQLKPISATLKKPITDTLKFITYLGYEIECTPEHKLYRLGDDGPVWTEARDFTTKDHLALQFGQECWCENNDISACQPIKRGDWIPPAIMTDELAYIIGLFIAEGSYSYNKLVIYATESDIISKLVNNNLGLNFIYEKKFQRLSLCNVRFIEFLRWLGFPEYTKANTKIIPQRMLQCSRRYILSMLTGMFDGDGHSSRHDGKVGYTSTSKLLIQQVRMLLLNLGIITKLFHDQRKTRKFKTYTSNLSGSYQLLLSSQDSAKFYDIVGFNIYRKQLKKIHLKSDKLYCFGIMSKFKELYLKYGPGVLGYNAIRHLLRSKFCEVTTALEKLKSWNNYSNDPAYQFINTRLNEITASNNAICWLPIRKIEKSKSEVCEITINDPKHSYTASGLISSNSQISRTVILAYIKKEGRDRKNGEVYLSHLEHRTRKASDLITKFLAEAHDICQYHVDYIEILEAMEWLILNDERPHDNLITKLVERTKLSRIIITQFIAFIKLRSAEFTYTPYNMDGDTHRIDKRNQLDLDDEA